jgi:general bacterial porin, GBP family
MQKKIIALAIAGLASTAAFAQSNVTIYGIADVGVAQVRGNGDLTGTKVISGGLSTSRIGFKGVEDLGNGLKALFVLEYRLSLDGNYGLGGNGVSTASDGGLSASGAARQQMVGLTGGFGTAVGGRLQTTAYDWQVKYITLAATAFDIHNQLTVPKFRINLQNDARANNAVAYISPSFGGVTVALNHSFAVEQAQSAVASSLNATLVGVYFDQGPLSIGLVGEKLQGNGAGAGFENTERTDLALGASYAFPFAKFTAAYQTTKNNGPQSATENNKFDTVYSIGAQVPVSAKGTVHVQFAQSNYKSNTLLNDNNGKGISIAYTHDLSKRTTVYAGYGYLDNSGSGNVYSISGASTGVVNSQGSSNVIATGLRHSF